MEEDAKHAVEEDAGICCCCTSNAAFLKAVAMQVSMLRVLMLSSSMLMKGVWRQQWQQAEDTVLDL
jgi:hypothetical protein